MSDIYMKVTYPIETPDEFQIETNAKPEVVGDLLGEFIHGQVGAGADNRPAIERNVYEITLSVDLSDDTWTVNHNCGNRGLREGILMDVMSRISQSKDTKWLATKGLGEEAEQLSEG